MKLECDPMAVLTEEHSAAEQRNYTGSFCGFVLLDRATYDLHRLAARLKQRWGMVPEVAEQAEITIEGGQEGGLAGTIAGGRNSGYSDRTGNAGWQSGI